MNEATNLLRDIFNEAAELVDTAERAAFLQRACRDDMELRRRIEHLLQAHEQAGGFLEHPHHAPGLNNAAAVSFPLTERAGDRIGRYKLLQQIGEGGCGIVYMAEQEEPVRRRVALKVIKLGMDTRSVIARFEAERQALALMDHPNIAKIFDAGITETPHPVSDHPLPIGWGEGRGEGRHLSAGRPYFVMELVRGIKITDYCDQNNLSTEERLKLFVQVCQAIQHAHQKGIIHRDIKPSNILVTVSEPGAPGCPKVIDFGIAKATTDQRLTDKTLFTAFEQFIGTPAYMSPEQAMMTSLDIDTRTDIYALGVLLYELLTGKTPFDATSLLAAGLDTLRRTICEVEPVKPSTRLTQEIERANAGKFPLPARNERGEGGGRGAAADTSVEFKSNSSPRPSPPSDGGEGEDRDFSSRLLRARELIPRLCGDLDWIVMKALEKDRARRYETANGLAMDIERHLKNEPVTARPPGNWYRLQKLVRRNRLAFAASGAVALITLAALVILVISNVRIRRETAEKAAAWSAARASERQTREQLFTSLLNQAQARRYSRQMGQSLDSLAAIAQATQIRGDPRLRAEAIAAMALPDVRLGPKWPVSRTNCVTLACDAIGQRYALLDYNHRVTVRSIKDNREIRRFETGPGGVERYTVLTFSPDGRFLAKMGNGQPPFLWLLETGEAILQDAPLGVSEPTFSANMRVVALADVSDVCCFDLATGRESKRWSTAGRVHALQFHPADGRLAVSYKDGPWVSVYDATTGREIARLEVGAGWNMVVSWHPDGRHLAVGSTALGIQVWDVEAQRRVARFEGHAPEMDFLTFHPSGNWLASWSWDGVIGLWEPMTGRQAMQIPLAAIPLAVNLQFSRDGRWLGFFWPSEDQVQLLEFVSPQEYFTLQANPGAERAAPAGSTTSPDDRLLAVAMADGVRLWDLAARREIAQVPSGATETVVFESDGRALWTCASNGLQRWPISSSGTNGSELRLGPPRRIELPFVPERISADRAVRTLAVVSEEAGRAALLDLATLTTRVLPQPQPMACYVALSPDGKWLATSGWHSDRIQLWNVASGELVRDWIVGLQTKVAFTPDSRELIVARGSEFSFLKVETLETSRRLRREIGLYPSDVAFSPDGKLMAMEMSPAVIHLKEVSTGRIVAQLEDPFGDRSDAISFSRDGTKLIVVSTYAAAVHVWDLRATRARLKTMGLDWDWPVFPPPGESEESRASLARAPLRIQVIGDTH